MNRPRYMAVVDLKKGILAIASLKSATRDRPTTTSLAFSDSSTPSSPRCVTQWPSDTRVHVRQYSYAPMGPPTSTPGPPATAEYGPDGTAARFLPGRPRPVRIGGVPRNTSNHSSTPLSAIQHRRIRRIATMSVTLSPTPPARAPRGPGQQFFTARCQLPKSLSVQ